MKRILSVLLACLLLCGLAMPLASAADPIDVSGAVPLAINTATKVSGGKVFSFMPAETGWFKFAVVSRVSFSFAVYDDELSQIVNAGFVSAPIVKLMAGKTYYFAIGISDGQQAYIDTIMPSLSQPPALKSDVMKIRTGSQSPNNPFRQSGYTGWTFTVNGQEPSAFAFSYYGDGFTATREAGVDSYQLQFTNYDGEDLGALTIVFEDWSLRAALRDYLEMMQADWANEDKTTKEWLEIVWRDFVLLVGSPVVALMIIFMGPMGWALLPVAFLPFIQLPMDIVGLFKSIFR